MINRPLEGVRVIDLTTFLSGPFATQALGQLGADVIKVEPPGGEATRRNPATMRNRFQLHLHRNRRSVEIDVKTDEGRALLYELLGKADVLIDNFRPGVTKRLGIDHTTVRARLPRLITCSISGFGPTGPNADSAALDGAVQAFCGAFDLTELWELGRVPIPMQAADIAGGVTGTQAVLAALFARERTGEACHIEISMAEAFLQWMSVVDRTGTMIPPNTIVATCQDGLDLIVQTPVHFRDRLMAVLQLGTDERFATPESRTANLDAFMSAARGVFAKKPRAEWLQVLAQSGLPAGAVLRYDEALRHPQISERHGTKVVSVDDGTGEQIVVRSPFVFDGERVQETFKPADVGEHTDEVLCNLLGHDTDSIARLRTSGALG